MLTEGDPALYRLFESLMVVVKWTWSHGRSLRDPWCNFGAEWLVPAEQLPMRGG